MLYDTGPIKTFLSLIFPTQIKWQMTIQIFHNEAVTWIAELTAKSQILFLEFYEIWLLDNLSLWSVTIWITTWI